MKLLRGAALIAAGLLLAAGPSPEGRRWWSYVSFLADDRLEGRAAGSEGYRKAAEYVAGQFEHMGLRPGGAQGYMQPVRFRTRRLVDKECRLALVRGKQAQPLVIGEDALLSARVDLAPSLEAPLVFVGYGLAIPEKNYDDFAGLDLRGKVAVYLSGGPKSVEGPPRSHAQSAAERNLYLRKAGAVGTIAIPNPKSMDIPWPRVALSRFQTAMSLADEPDESRGLRLAAVMNPARAEKLFAGTSHTFEEILAADGDGKPLPRFPLSCSVRAKAALERGEVVSSNVIAILPGADPALRNEYVVISAHLDHLGIGEPIAGDRIYNGAMDDASGVATVLDVARGMREAKVRPRRSILFAVVTAEEKGLLGSRWFASHPTVDAHTIVADLNVDMFLPLYPLKSVIVYGLRESTLGEVVRQVAARQGVKALDDPEPARNSFIRSDQYSFIRRGIPALAFKVGFDRGSREEKMFKAWLKERYHAPSDDLAQPVDLGAAEGFNRLIGAVAEAVADAPERPAWRADSFFRRFAR